MLLAQVALAGSDPLAVHASVHTLPNGLTVILEEDDRTDQVALNVHYGVGSRDEKPGELGCAHLFEHIMFEGSKDVPPNDFDTWLTAAGGWNNAYTSEDETVYYMEFPSGALDLALFLESDRMGFLLDGLTQTNLENQQSVVLQERDQDYAEPNGRDQDALTRLQYPEGHPYHHPVIGTVADVKGFRLAGVKDFWRRHYRPRNAVLTLVGHIDPDEALARVQHWFSDVPDPGPATPRTEKVDLRAKAKVGVLEDHVEDDTVYLSWQTVPIGAPDEAALDILAQILSGGRGTRLDDRLSYNSSLATDDNAYHWTSEFDGQFVITATADGPRLSRLKKLAEKEVAKLQQQPPTAAEVQRARQQLRSDLLDNLEDPVGRARALSDCWRRHGTPDCLAEDWARYVAVTPEDVSRVARTWLGTADEVVLSTVPEGGTGAIEGGTPVELP